MKKREFKFDLDVFLECCEEAGVPVQKGPGGITLDGKPINIAEEILKALTDPSVFAIPAADAKVDIKGMNEPENNAYTSADGTLLAA